MRPPNMAAHQIAVALQGKSQKARVPPQGRQRVARGPRRSLQAALGTWFGVTPWNWRVLGLASTTCFCCLLSTKTELLDGTRLTGTTVDQLRQQPRATALRGMLSWLRRTCLTSLISRQCQRVLECPATGSSRMRARVQRSRRFRPGRVTKPSASD